MRVINEDIAGLRLMAWAAIQKETINTINSKARTVNEITALLLDTDHTPKDKEDAAYMIGMLLIQ